MATTQPVQCPGLLSDALADEALNYYSRSGPLTISKGQNLLVNTVIGQDLFDVPTTGTPGTNTGTGNCTDVIGADDTQRGVYTLTCIKVETNAGDFSVIAPNGNKLKDAKVGVAYLTDEIGLTINDGETDFILGDSFTITVAKGSLEVTLLDLTKTNGLQKAIGFTIEAYDAVDEAVQGIAIVRDAQIKALGLVWPEGITTEQKEKALEQLAERGLIPREEG